MKHDKWKVSVPGPGQYEAKPDLKEIDFKK